MILTDREIQIGIERGLIIVNPRPADVAYGSTSLDLTLDEVISEFNRKSGAIKQIIDPTDPEFDSEVTLSEITTKRTIDGTSDTT